MSALAGPAAYLTAPGSLPAVRLSGLGGGGDPLATYSPTWDLEVQTALSSPPARPGPWEGKPPERLKPLLWKPQEFFPLS